MSRTSAWPARAPGAEVRVGDELEGELHILGREGLAVVPADVVAQADAPLRGRPPRCRRSSGSAPRPQGSGWRTPFGSMRKSASNTEKCTRVVDLDMRHQRIEDRGLLRKPDDDAAGWACWRGLARRRACRAGWARRGRQPRLSPSSAARRVANRSIWSLERLVIDVSSLIGGIRRGSH